MKDILYFLPLFLIYILIVLVANNDSFFGDEGRYVMYADNLLKGYYSPLDKVHLWNGPGYPIILMPYVKFKLPWLTAKLMNPMFHFIAILYFYHTLSLYMNERSAIFYSYMLGIYLPIYRFIHLVLSESLAIFLVCGFIFHFCKLHREERTSWSQLLIASFFLGYLVLTKIFFGYVVLIGLMMFILLFLWKKRNAFKKTFLVYLLALLCCVPYLTYTYNLTGEVFYWGDRAGLALYLMSSPYQGEYGDWFAKDSKYHQEVYYEFKGLTAVERDNYLKKKAVENIINHPAKYCLNLMANVGRLFFNYPFSYDLQRLSTYFYILPNMFLVVFGTLCLYPSYMGRRQIPFEMYALFIFALISFGGLTIVHSENRSLWPLIPIILLWISFVSTRFVKIEIQK